MATLSVQSVSKTGLSPTYTSAAGGGDKVKPGDHTWIHVRNGGGSSVTVTVDDTKTAAPDGYTAFDPDLEVVIEPGGNRHIGPLPETRFRGDDGLVHITYSGVSSVTIAALRA